MSEIKRPALKYYGGKWNLGKWIISHFPEHHSYVEPCGGAASVLIQKPRSDLETYNDLDMNIVNFFRVLRDNPDELLQRLKLTLWSRWEYENTSNMTNCEIEWARQTFVTLWLSISGNFQRSGFRCVKSNKGYNQTLYFDDLWKIAERFMGVQIEHLPALEITGRYDTPKTLFYFDPPYLPETRSNKKSYQIEPSVQFHIDAAKLLNEIKGMAVVSGYAHPLYTELYEDHGWIRHDQEALTNSGNKRFESIWLSPKTHKALESESVPDLQMKLL